MKYLLRRLIAKLREMLVKEFPVHESKHDRIFTAFNELIHVINE